MRRQITAAEILQSGLQNLRDATYHTMPGIVAAYYAADNTADVTPATHDVRFDTTTGERISEPWPIIPRVRVLWPRFGALAVWCDLSPGDKVTLLGYDLDPTAHRASGQAEDPIDTRRHGGGYWAALPGDVTDAGVLPATGGKIMLGEPGGVMVAVSAAEVDLGAAAPSDRAALASILDSFIHVFLATWTPVPNDGGAALKTALTAWAASLVPPYSTTGSSKVKLAP